MARASRIFVPTLLLLLVLPAAAGAATPTPIAGARALPLGTTVTVEGEVTVPSGLFSSASLEDQGFAMQDVTGGIYVRLDTNLGIHRNQQVRVTGTLDQSFNILFVRAVPSGVVRLPGSPLLTATGEVGAATEGLSITFAGVITDIFDDGTFGVQLTIDDGSGALKVFIHRSTGINTESPFIGVGKRIQATGFSSRFADEVELQPRFPSDIHPD